MLQHYAVTNFQSFLERAEVDFRVNRKSGGSSHAKDHPTSNWLALSSTNELVTKVMCVLGPNGGGKTALIKPVAFLSWFIAQSFQAPPDSPIPVTPHILAADKPTELECTVDFDGMWWRYELVCTPQRVLREVLWRKVINPHAKLNRFTYVFSREFDEKSAKYEIKQQDFGFLQKEAEKVRPNASLISTAAQYGVDIATRLVSMNIQTNVNILGRIPNLHNYVQGATHYYANNDAQKSVMNKLISSWDFGLSGVEFRPIPMITSPAAQNGVSGELQPAESPKFFQAFGVHRAGMDEFSLPFQQESSGTQTAFVLLSMLLHALDEGGIAVIDELECDLHPHMLSPLLDLFANPATNPKKAQLLFTCHSPEILRHLQKYQITLVEKYDCKSECYRLDELEGIRNVDNYYAKYMAGAFGAVPRI